MRSLSARLAAGALLWILLLLAAGGAVLSSAFRDTVERFQYERLDALLRAVVAAADVAPDGSVQLLKALGEPRFEQVFSGWYWQISDQADAVARSRSLWDQSLDTHAGESSAAVQHRETAGPMGARLMVVERDLDFGPRRLHVQVAADRAEIDAVLGDFHSLLATALGLLGIGLLAAVFVQIGFGLRPLRALAAQLRDVRAGRRERIGGPQPAEVEELVTAMNAVLDRDAALIERARTHVGNLAHALKTPLSVLKLSHDSAAIDEQVAAMDRLVAHHLTRAAAGASAPAFARVDAEPVLDSLRAVIARMFRDHTVTLTVEGCPRFPGSREDLEELAGNLMENAAKWARSQVRVELREPMVLLVEDDGPGMSAEDAAAAAGRGVRLDEKVPGTGLGLAIVADLVALYGGRLAFGRSDLGGLRVEVVFPE